MTAVLIPRGGSWGEDVRRACSVAGLHGRVVPVIERITVTGEPQHRIHAAIASGRYSWVVVTSAAAAAFLDGSVPPESTQVAAVGAATANALERIGWTVHLMPARATAAHLARELTGASGEGDTCPADSARANGVPERPVLLPQSSLAHPTLHRDLQHAGWRAEKVIAYRTQALTPSDDDLRLLREGSFSYALVTSGSVARALWALQPPSSLVGVSMGAQSTRDALHAGWTQLLEAPEPRVEAMITTIQHHRSIAEVELPQRHTHHHTE